ncbi:MAG: hypothetical protein NVS3B26_25520 [Mycobacteriales bacterium]
MSLSRTRLVAATAAGTGLAAGLFLGVAGLASASTTTTSPSSAPDAAASGQHHGPDGGPGRHGRHGRHGRGGALVTSVNGNTITLDTPRGTKTVTVNSATVYKHGTATAALSDVKVHYIVRVQLVDPNASAPVAKEVRIEMARVDGYVTAVSGSTVTVIDGGGFTRTVQESQATTYRDAGNAGSPAEVAVGKYIRAEGNVDPNGTTLDATRIGTGQPQPAPADSSPADRGNG